MFGNRRERRGGLGLLLLLERLMSVGSVGPITLLTIAGQSLLYMGIINPPWHSYDVCLSGEAILRYKNYSRLLLSAIEHSDDIHLYHNMVSFLFKGRTLERLFGSVKFFILLVVFTLATSLTYVGLAWAATEYFKSYSYMRECAVGFSGILVGVAYVYGPLSGVVNAIHTTVAGPPRPSYTYAYGTTRGYTYR